VLDTWTYSLIVGLSVLKKFMTMKLVIKMNRAVLTTDKNAPNRVCTLPRPATFKLMFGARMSSDLILFFMRL